MPREILTPIPRSFHQAAFGQIFLSEGWILFIFIPSPALENTILSTA